MSTRTHFQQWFPYLEHYFLNILRTQCTQEFHDYLIRNSSAPCSEPDPASCYVANVVNCVIANTSASTNANISVTSVLLGLLPTILLQTGATLPQYTYLFVRRPVLAFLLAMSTAPVSTAKTSDYEHPKLSTSSLPPPRNHLQRLLVLVLEYVMATAAMINLLVILWQITTRSTIAWSHRFTWGALVWIITTLVIHIASYITLRLKLKIVRTPIKQQQRTLLSSFVSYIRQEFTLSGESMSHTTIQLVAKRETWRFLVLAWFVSLAATFHWIYGSVMLAGLMFIGVKDSLVIALRFIISTVIAKLILMYELSGMRATIQFDDNYLSEARTSEPAAQDVHTGGSSDSTELEELSGRLRVMADKQEHVLDE